jgi:hypothetical protein
MSVSNSVSSLAKGVIEGLSRLEASAKEHREAIEEALEEAEGKDAKKDFGLKDLAALLEENAVTLFSFGRIYAVVVKAANKAKRSRG